MSGAALTALNRSYSKSHLTISHWGVDRDGDMLPVGTMCCAMCAQLKEFGEDRGAFALRRLDVLVTDGLVCHDCYVRLNDEGRLHGCPGGIRHALLIRTRPAECRPCRAARTIVSCVLRLRKARLESARKALALHLQSDVVEEVCKRT
jgi:hypothetical protein